MLTLHYSPASPFVRKVRILLHETGQTDEVKLNLSTGTVLEPGTLPVGLNPLGKIPALERPEGCTLYDSRVICRYLAERNEAGRALYPAPPRLWEVLTLEATADGIMEAAVLMRYEIALRPEGQRSPGWLDGQWAKVSRSLDALEGRWMAHLTGPRTIGQLATASALGYLDFRHADRPWRAARPALAQWFEGFAARPSMLATRPEG